MQVTKFLFFIFCCISITIAGKSKSSNITKLSADILDDKERIIGGEFVQDGEIAYQLSLRRFRFHNCGASLIEVEDTMLAITAAHCTEGVDPEELTLVAGDSRISDRSGREQERQVVKIVNHEMYDPDTISYDIALLFIDEPFKINDWVSPIPLPEQGIETTGTAILSGWGFYDRHGFYADNLTKLEVPIVNDELCKKAYTPLEYEYFDHFICAGYLGIGAFKDSCKGDSGGPLKSVESGYLAGIISWSEGCAHPRFPGVNTEVSHFIDWINSEVAKYTDTDDTKDSNNESKKSKFPPPILHANSIDSKVKRVVKHPNPYAYKYTFLNSTKL